MKVLIVLVLATLTYANVQLPIEGNTAYGYIQNYAIPLAEEIRKAEEQMMMTPERIAGGSPSGLGRFPYQAGLIGTYGISGITATGVCGGSIISSYRVTRILTAAHCWNDGFNQAWRFTIVLGTPYLFFGGLRLESSAVAIHPEWQPRLVRNDVLLVYLPAPVVFTDFIAPIALPSGDQVQQDFVGVTAVASGFGLIGNGGSISNSQTLHHVNLTVITNSDCSLAFPSVIQTSNICTSGVDGVGTCRGDSGGPLATITDGKPVQIGIASFGSARGCEAGLPSAYTRVTSVLNWINNHL